MSQEIQNTKVRCSLQDKSAFMGRALKAEKGTGGWQMEIFLNSFIVFPKYSGLDEYLAIPITTYVKLSSFMNLNLGEQIQLHFVSISYNEIKCSVEWHTFFFF